MKNFFYPRSLCVVGASSKEKSIGYEILRSIKEYSFTGEVLPVNPNAEEILGYKCYSSILDIKTEIDLAIIVVPKKFIDESINEVIEKNVKSIVLITAGFKETGEQGKEREEKLLEKLKKHNIRMIGPNCMGLINTLNETKLNATFVAEKPRKGGIGFLSQSGAIGAAILNSLRETDIRFAHFISIGNKADVCETDVMEYWLEDNNVKTITMYLESFENGLEFIRSFTNSNNKKPLIILKSGKTEAGMKAASSHTGALSNNEKIINSLFEQFGIIRANDLNELFNTAKGFEHFPLPKGNKVVVVTNAGGPAILAVDKIEEEQLQLVELSDKTKEKLKEVVHPEGSINNPVDLLPGASPEIYKKVNEIVAEDENVDAVISIFVEPIMVSAMKVIEVVNSITSAKPIYQVCMPLPEFWSDYLENSKYEKPIFRNPEDPSEVISNILHYKSKKNKKTEIEVKQIARNNNSEFLDQIEINKLSKKYNLPIVESEILSLDELRNKDNFSFPIVVKGLSKDIVHKSELDAVKLNINNKDELINAVDEIKQSFSKNGFPLKEIFIQPFITTKHELLIGGFRDPSFGPVIMFGSGGKYVEALDDTIIKSAYLDEDDLDEIINKTKIGKILKGIRGEKSVDLIKLKSIIKSVAKLMIEKPEITEIDLNPLVVDVEDKFYAVDIRIKIEC